MNKEDRKNLESCCEELIPKINLKSLWPKLLDNGVFNRDDVNVPKWTRNLNDRETVKNVYLTIKTRGPNAYQNFLRSLYQSNHGDVAEILETRNNNQYNKNSNGNTENSNSDDNYYNRLQNTDKPLKINVRKATKFLDAPEQVEELERYPMKSSPRGFVLIISNIRYPVGVRDGADHDDTNLRELFEQMGFEVTNFKDLTGKDILNKVKEFSEMKDFRKVHSCFVIISSHGKEIGDDQLHTSIQGIDCNSPSYQKVLCTDIMDFFTPEKCPDLAGKPKVFIFQACRGEKVQTAINRIAKDGIPIQTESELQHSKKEITKKDYMQTVRKYSDTLVVYATIPGFVSYRDTINGSYCIQILCEVFMNHAWKMHLQDLFNLVDARLQQLRCKNGECQTLMYMSIGFNKHCYLNPGLFDENNQ